MWLEKYIRRILIYEKDIKGEIYRDKKRKICFGWGFSQIVGHHNEPQEPKISFDNQSEFILSKLLIATRLMMAIRVMN